MNDEDQTSEQAEAAVTMSVDIDAEVAQVWAALVTDGGLEPWMGEGATIDPRVGGTLTFPDPAGGRLRHGKVTTVEQERRLEYVWWPADRATERSSVVITVEPSDSGSRLTVVEAPLQRRSIGFQSSGAGRSSASTSVAARSRSLIGTWSWRLAMITLAGQIVRI